MKSKSGDKNLFFDTNALIYLYEFKLKNKKLNKLKIDGEHISMEKYINYVMNNCKKMFFCSDSYYEFICHCFKNNCKEDFLNFYCFINGFCKEIYEDLPLVISTKEYYEFNTKKLKDDLSNGKIDYQSYVNERIEAKSKLLKNMYIPLICTIKEMLKNKYPSIELHEEKDKETIELIDKSIKEMLFIYYNTNDKSELNCNKCINIPISIVIKKYCNFNNCNYIEVENMIQSKDDFDICACLNSFLKNIIKTKGENIKITEDDFYSSFCNITKSLRKKNNEIVLYDYIDFLIHEMLFKMKRKIRKNDIVDASIISTILLYLENNCNCENNVFITFDKNVRKFIEEQMKNNNSSQGKNIYNRLSLFKL